MFDYDSDYEYDDNECYIDLNSINEIVNDNKDNQLRTQEANSHDDALSQTNSVSLQHFTLYIANIITELDSNGNPFSKVDEQFIVNLFKSCHISISLESVQVITKKNFRSTPYTYALVKLDTKEEAMNAIKELNLTKFNDVPIYIFLIDKNTQKTLNNNQGCLLIKNIGIEIEASTIFETFSKFGEIIYCHVPQFKINGYPDVVSCGYCYLQFLNPEDAMNALEMLKDSTINGKIVEVHPFYRHADQRNKETYQKCLIKNFPENYKDEDLKQIFSEFGTPISCRVVFDKNGKSKQIGFCRMLKHKEAVKAIEGLNGKKIENFEIVCCPALSSRKFAYESKSKEIVKLHSFIEKMKEIQKNLLNFLEDDEMSEKKDQKFIEFLNKHQIDDDKFKSFLLLILNVSNNHNRNQFFFTKIFLILRIYKSKIKQLYSNNDIFNLFKSNKQILLFLIQEQIIIFNESIACNLPRGERWICEYEDYFCP